MSMRILAFTDPHGQLKNAESVRDLAKREHPDLVACPGDFTFFGSYDKDFFKVLAEIGMPIYFIPGNHEDESCVRKLVAEHGFLRDVSFTLREEDKAFLGGVPGNDAAFWPGTSKRDIDLRTSVNKLMVSRGVSKPFVFLAHYPPSGCRAVDGTKKPTPDSGGSRLVRQLVEDLQPALVLTGHYHQCFGERGAIGAAKVINPGPAGAILEL